MGDLSPAPYTPQASTMSRCGGGGQWGKRRASPRLSQAMLISIMRQGIRCPSSALLPKNSLSFCGYDSGFRVQLQGPSVSVQAAGN